MFDGFSFCGSVVMCLALSRWEAPCRRHAEQSAPHRYPLGRNVCLLCPCLLILRAAPFPLVTKPWRGTAREVGLRDNDNVKRLSLHNLKHAIICTIHHACCRRWCSRCAKVPSPSRSCPVSAAATSLLLLLLSTLAAIIVCC